MKVFRYIPVESAIDWLDVGWLIVADLGPYHGQFSLLGEWLCRCSIVEPGEKPNPPSFVDRPFGCPPDNWQKLGDVAERVVAKIGEGV